MPHAKLYGLSILMFVFQASSVHSVVSFFVEIKLPFFQHMKTTSHSYGRAAKTRERRRTPPTNHNDEAQLLKKNPLPCAAPYLTRWTRAAQKQSVNDVPWILFMCGKRRGPHFMLPRLMVLCSALLEGKRPRWFSGGLYGGGRTFPGKFSHPPLEYLLSGVLFLSSCPVQLSRSDRHRSARVRVDDSDKQIPRAKSSYRLLVLCSLLHEGASAKPMKSASARQWSTSLTWRKV